MKNQSDHQVVQKGAREAKMSTFEPPAAYCSILIPQGPMYPVPLMYPCSSNLLYHLQKAQLQQVQAIAIRIGQLGITTWEQVLAMRIADFGTFVGLLCMKMDDARALGKYWGDCLKAIQEHGSMPQDLELPGGPGPGTTAPSSNGPAGDSNVGYLVPLYPPPYVNGGSKKKSKKLSPEKRPPADGTQEGGSMKTALSSKTKKQQQQDSAPGVTGRGQHASKTSHLSRRRRHNGNKKDHLRSLRSPPPPAVYEPRHHLSSIQGWACAAECSPKESATEHDMGSPVLSEWDGAWFLAHITRRAGGAVLVKRSTPFELSGAKLEIIEGALEVRN
jgi:hypothetical protein